MNIPTFAAVSWVRPWPTHRCEDTQLLCLPHAGAGASIFYPWRKRIAGEQIELLAIQYPGREERLGEPKIENWAVMVSALAKVWAQLPGRGRRAIFGHSMGALIAFELTRELVRRGDPNLPCRIFLSGQNPPHNRTPLSDPQSLSDERFLSEIYGKHGTELPVEITSDPETRSVYVPILRSDYQLCESYSYIEGPPLNIPFSLFGGSDDLRIGHFELAEWKRYCIAPCRMRLFRGDHFFHQSAGDRVVAAIVEDLSLA